MTPPAARRPFAADPQIAALRQSRTPTLARVMMGCLIASFVFLPLLLLFTPWQQTVRGRGQVVAFAPTERKQVVTARISGQIRKWHVVEGSRVKKGQPIVDIEDNDAGRGDRLKNSRDLLYDQRVAAVEQVAQQKAVVAHQRTAMEAGVSAASASRDATKLRIGIARQSLDYAKAQQAFEAKRLTMFNELLSHKASGGLAPEIDRDKAKLEYDQAGIKIDTEEMNIKNAQAALMAAEAAVEKAVADGMSSVAAAERSLQQAQQSAFKIDQDLQSLDSEIERFKSRFVSAPTDGTVFRISANAAESGQYVKDGEELAVIVPDTTDRVVELMLDGVDAPLVAAHMEETGEWPHVRLMFEGWPGVQFTGWPSVAVGTFGGRVRQMDATDDGNGRFRVLVEPDKMPGDDDWPDAQYLRQGNQAIGYVFLNRVTLGYELWRQLNGFPPVIAPKSPDKKDAKPPKIKVP